LIIFLTGLKEIAHKKGVSVIATIHQPSQSTFYMFDTLVLLVGGRIAYWGPTKEAVSYLSSSNEIEIPPRVAG